MGERLWLRSNFGLVLATGFHDGMSGKDQRQAFVDRMDSVDPLMSDTAYARMQQMGELAYNRKLAGRARAWISAHPTQSPGNAPRYRQDAPPVGQAQVTTSHSPWSPPPQPNHQKPNTQPNTNT